MRRLFHLTAILVLLAPAAGCESCLTRGAKAQPYPTCAPACEPGCVPSCAPGGAGRRLFVVRPTVGVTETTMSGPPT